MSCEENSEVLSRFKIRTILGTMKARGYVIYTEPFKMNIVGVRNTDTSPVKFDDTLYVIWKNDKGSWRGKKYIITTDPSTRYLKRPINKLGAAILPNGQYVDSWKIRKHNGKYYALGQNKPVCVYRDYDRGELLNFDIKSKSCGLYGINIHRAKSGKADDGKGNTEKIGPYSAGCQVFQNSYCFDEFMKMAYRQKELYGNKFTYTLFDWSLLKKIALKRTIFASAVVVSLGLMGAGFYTISKERNLGDQNLLM